MRLSERHEQIFKFRFECDQNAGITINSELVESEKFRLVHLVFSQKEREGMNSIIVLGTLVDNYNGLMTDFVAQAGLTENSVRIGKLNEKDLRLYTEQELKEVVFEMGVTNPNFDRQTEVFFDFEGVERKVKAKLLDKFARIEFEKDSLQDFRGEGDRKGLPRLIEEFTKIFSEGNERNTSNMGSFYESKINSMDINDRTMCYNIVLSSMYKVLAHKETDGSLTLPGFLSKRDIMLPSYTSFSPDLLTDLELPHLTTVMEKLEFVLVERYFLKQVPTFFQEALGLEDLDDFKDELKEISRKSREQLHQMMTQLVVRYAPEMTFQMSQLCLWEYFQASDLGEMLLEGQLSQDNSMEQFVKKNKILLTHLHFFFSQLLWSL